MNATVRSKTSSPKPPERGSFPLDHEAECLQMVDNYLGCLRDNNFVSSKCEYLKKDYLQCRMQRGLMAEEDLSQLGLRDYDNLDVKAPDRKKEEEGFIAGVSYLSALAQAKEKKS